MKRFKKSVRKESFLISAATKSGIDKLIKAVYEKLAALPPMEKLDYEPFEYQPRNTTGFTVTRDDDGGFDVSGGLVEELSRNVVLDSYDSFNWFQKKLKETGVIKALRRAGAKDGDTVRVMDIEFEFVE